MTHVQDAENPAAASLDDPKTTDITHRAILARKPFLRKLYSEHYQFFKAQLAGHGPRTRLVELGSGGGFLKQILPGTVTSDVMKLSGLDLRFSGLAMPFKADSVDAFFLLDTFHHIPDAGAFLTEAARCLKKNGLIVMVEPANTPWGRFIYKNFHHEPFEPDADWTFASKGPLSSANGALAWIVFSRDRARFAKTFPNLRVRRFQPLMPIRYLLSGGFSKPQLTPSASYPFWAALENLFSPCSAWTGMFYRIVIEKSGDPADP